MTEIELRIEVIDCLREAHYITETFLHGEEYVKKNVVWIERDFHRQLKKMTNSDWKRLETEYLVQKGCLEALENEKEEQDGNLQ